MAAAALLLIAVPLAWYALGVIGAVRHPRRDGAATALAAVPARRPVSVDPPSIWPSEVVEPIRGVVTFSTGTDPTLVEGRFIQPPPPRRTAARQPAPASRARKRSVSVSAAGVPIS